MEPETRKLLKSCLNLAVALQYSAEEIVEYSSWTSDTIMKCPLCLNTESNGHTEDCCLGQLVRELTEVVGRD